MISIDGPPIHDFNFQETFSKWASKKERRSFNNMYLKEAKIERLGQGGRKLITNVENEDEPQNCAEGHVDDYNMI